MSATTHVPDGLVVGAKVTPTVTYVAAHASGWSIGEWAAAAALIYSLLMIGDFLARRVVKPLYRRIAGRP